MLQRSTTFVLGAGASHDFGFPTGDGLQARVVELLQTTNAHREFSNKKIWAGIVPSLEPLGLHWSGKAAQLIKAAQKIAAGMPPAASIDNFLHTHRNDQDVVFLGKLAISLAILESEAQSGLRSSERDGRDVLSRKKFQDSWYAPFIKMLTAGALYDRPEELFDNAKFVVFNYDRCLKLILLKTLQAILI